MDAHEWASWHLVKYQSDVRRGEPRNVGVIVQSGGQTAMRFFGEDAERNIDGRVIRPLAVGSVENYKRWVDYFRRAQTNARVEETLARWRERRTESSYYVGDPNSIATRGLPVEALVDQLYAELVSAKPVQLVKAAVQEEAESVIAALFDRLQVIPDVRPTRFVKMPAGAGVGTVSFGYGYTNGRLHLVDKLTLAGTRDLARMAAYDFAQRAQLARAADWSHSFVAFYTRGKRPLSHEAESAVQLVGKLAKTIDLEGSHLDEQAAEALGIS